MKDRKLVLAFVVAMVTAVFGCSVAVVSAQTPASKPAIFDTQKSCEAALASQNFSYYAPVDLSRKTKDPIDGKTVFGVKLEADQCRRQLTMQGEKWVVQSEGSMMKAHKNEAGELAIFARDDCGNKDTTPTPTVPQTPPVTPLQPPPPPAPVVVPPPQPAVPAPPVSISDAVAKVTVVIVPSPAATTPPPPTMKKSSHRWVWWVVGGAVVAGGAYATWYYWPCPPGTVKR